MPPLTPVSRADVRLVVFDWDQTLLNGWALHLKGVEYAARTTKQSVPPEDRVVDLYYSMPFVEHLESLLPMRTPEAVNAYVEFYKRNFRDTSKLFDGAVEALEAIKAAGCLVGLLSDKREEYGVPELRALGISDAFDKVLFMRDDRAHKPDPQGLSTVCSGLSVPPRETLYVGDSWVDVKCASSLGAASGAALWGSMAPEKTLSECPDYTFESISDLVGFFK